MVDTSQYLKASRVLIVDQNSSARVGLKKMLVNMGVGLNHIFQANSFEEAEEIINSQNPLMVFCDYQVGQRYGLELLQKQRQKNKAEIEQSLFVLVTANTSQSAVAQAAEEDVDAYILKPYTIESFTHSLLQAIQLKIQPTEYLSLIKEGKDLLAQNQLDDAKSIFDSAMTKDEKPSLACYYEGLIFFRKTLIDQSESVYEKGLSFNKIHYKCLVGLFDLLVSLQKFEAAYEIVQRIVRFFPANPKRLSTVLKLAIQTKHYDDIGAFYDEFLKIEERSDELVKSVCAALIVCGRYFFEENDKKNGIDLVRKATVTAAGRAFLLKKAVETFIDHGELLEAKMVLKRFPVQSEEDPQYAVAALLVSRLEDKPDLVASRGQALLKKGVLEREVYEVTIENLEKLGKNERAMELLQEALKHYPEMKHEDKKAA